MTSQNIEISPRGTANAATGGCACCSSGSTSSAASAPAAAGEWITAVYQVDGMTCGHCVSAVREELSNLDTVTGVDVDLVAGGASTVTVTSTAPLSQDAVAAAVDEAGYTLAAAG